MRILTIAPGPAFSTFDVHQGWVRAFRELGCDVGNIDFGARLDVFWNAHVKKQNGRFTRAFDDEGAHHLARQSIKWDLWDYAPDVVFVTAGHFIREDWYDNVRARGRVPIVLLCTESPYEDTWQLKIAAHVDMVFLNDPTHLEVFKRVQPRSYYMPHAYDPRVHHPRPAEPDLKSDFAFVGTLYPERQEFLEAVDWDGISVALGGNMSPLLNNDSPLLAHVIHPIDECCPNDLTARVYASTKASVNLYRRQAHRPELIDGWSMGPREVELAACKTFFLTEPRGENRSVLPMIPTFTSPDEFASQLRWWLAHDSQRERVVEQAASAVADRTFTNNARRLLELVEHL